MNPHFLTVTATRDSGRPTKAASQREGVPIEDPVAPSVIRICAHCATEIGRRPGPGETHGICKRHFIAMFRAAGLPEQSLTASLAKKTEADYCQDLYEVRNSECGVRNENQRAPHSALRAPH